ncbi:armadillo-type protein [Podospora fimiseda]|uniref:Armadillo-type protein n=1 Tax=Podospora fimiseda TaxID=252190 RepID=A0AAN7BN98_9PEZI|nr:armadillo-type protein [Podospora fimiseda]
MARVQSPPVFAQLRQARNFTEQASSLRALRTEIVGHVQQKEIWVQRGVLEALVQTLQETVKESGSAYDPTAELTEAEVVQLLCLQILDSISGDGPCFLPPLHAARTIPTVLPYISPVENPPKVVLFALRVIRNIRDATDLLPPGSDNNTDTLSGAVFAPACLESLYAILVQTRTDSVTQEQKRLVSVLISRLCKKPEHQNSLADAGILDALATMLASFVVSRGEVVPGADEFGEHDGLVNFIPSPAPQGASLALTLGAISAIIIGSRFHVYAFLCSPAILAVFPLLDFDPAGGQEAKAAWSGLEEHGYGDLGEKPQGAMEYLLPIIPVSQPRGLSVQFAQYTPLGFSSARDSNPSTARGTAYKFTGLDPSGENPDADDPGSPAIPWLMHLVRDTSGLERVAAADVLTSLYKAGFASPDREQALGPLVVTLLCELIKDHDKAIPDAVRQETLIEEEVAENWAILEKTPEVLARLVSDSECLQQAAHDCGTIVLAAKLLKDSYEAMPVQSPPKQWSPNPDSNINFDELPLSSQLGELGMLPLYAHRIRMRERALKLVASMATQKDELQKALSEQDVVPYVVESLTELPRKPQSAKEKQAAEKEGEDQENPQPLYGINPNEVIIAACHALRCISRSVSIVRTTLQDHEVWKPIVKLLKHPDSEVEIAASGAVINLLTSCSPMVGALTDVGIVKILCEHAHSQVPGLRLNALWGLKHLVLDVSVPLRKQILEELEPGWLVQLISDDNSEEDEAIQSARQRRAPDEDDDEDMGADATPYEEESRPWTWQVLSRDYPTPELSAAVANSSRIKKANARLLAVREAELNPARKARNDTIDIQEKGLGFIRNLTMLHKKEDQVEIVDHLFSVLGQDRLFGILADKLNIRVVGAYGRRHSKGRDTVVVYPQARIVENLTYILVHIAASVPRHRQLVIAQTELLKLLGGHFNDKDVGVRRALCHLFDNLSCLECEEDRQPCLSRTAELEKLGFLAKLEGLWHGDADLDVRERAKQVVEQMKTVS